MLLSRRLKDKTAKLEMLKMSFCISSPFCLEVGIEAILLIINRNRASRSIQVRSLYLRFFFNFWRLGSNLINIEEL